jgi:hypothetical protein
LRDWIHTRALREEEKPFGNEVIYVEMKTIDELFYDKRIQVNYIKADLEGWEMEMIEGAVKTIRQYTPKMAITTYYSLNNPLALIRFINQIEPSYRIRAKGIDYKKGNPEMLHFYV